MSLKSSRNAAETPEGRVAGRRRAGRAGLILPAGDAGTGDPEPGPVSGRGGSFLVPGGGARALLILPPLDRPEDEERLQVPGPGAFFAPPMPGAMSRSAVQRALSGQIAFAAQGRRVEGGAVAGPRSGNPRRKRAAPVSAGRRAQGIRERGDVAPTTNLATGRLGVGGHLPDRRRRRKGRLSCST